LGEAKTTLHIWETTTCSKLLITSSTQFKLISLAQRDSLAATMSPAFDAVSNADSFSATSAVSYTKKKKRN
jgi:predicted peptidase